MANNKNLVAEIAIAWISCFGIFSRLVKYAISYKLRCELQRQRTKIVVLGSTLLLLACGPTDENSLTTAELLAKYDEHAVYIQQLSQAGDYQ